jgi:hypothetical protein
MQTSQAPYSHIWHKYRPAILRLMVDAEKAPQQYKFSGHEFRQIFPKNRTSLAFNLNLHRSKAVNNIRTSPLAHALLKVLQDSQTAVKLSEGSSFDLTLDDKFIFRVRKNKSGDTADVATASAVASDAMVIS